MKYQIGSIGRIVVARFEDGEDIIGNIIEIAKKETIKHAIFYLIGGVKEGKIVVGPEKDELPPEPIWKEIQESHEILGIGTIFYQDEEPRTHLHGAFGKRDRVSTGCLRGVSKTYLIIEAIIVEINDITAKRVFDHKTGLSLLSL